MSTNALVASDLSGHLQGVSVHWDGYPSHLGRVLHRMCAEHFESDPAAMAAYLIDEHPGGWSSLGGDASVTIGADQDRHDENGCPVKELREANCCYCHCQSSVPDQPISAAMMASGECSFAQWTYRIELEGLQVSRGARPLEDPDITVPWDCEPDWGVVECGQAYERCLHICSAHFQVPPESEGLSTAKWLGREPLELRDAAGYVIPGHGAGRRTGHLRKDNRGTSEELVFHNGTRRMVLVRGADGSLLDGIEALMPSICLDDPGRLSGILPGS